MKAMFWKELRKIAVWGVLILSAFTAISVLSLVLSSPYNRFIFDVEFAALLLGGAVVTAVILGVLQTVYEVRRDPWAFLVHRNLSMSQIFLAKVAAGLTVYMVVLVVPASMATLWYAYGGIERFPFSWQLTLPMVNAVLLSASYYFAAMLAVLWRVPGYVTRLLPLVGAWLMSCIFVTFLEFDRTTSVASFVYSILAVVVLGWATWGVFVSSGEASRRPFSSTICLGVTLFAVIGGTAMFVSTELPRNSFRDSSYWKPDAFLVSPVAYMIGREGHLLRVQSAFDDTTHESKLKFTDLDERDIQSATSLNGKLITSLSDAEASQGLMTMAEIGPGNSDPFAPYPSNHRMWQIANFGHVQAMTPVVGNSDSPVSRDEVAAASNPDVNKSINDVNWIYSAPDGWLYGYRESPARSDGLSPAPPPRLESIAGPDGFTDAAHRPQHRFGRLIAASPLVKSGSTAAVWPDMAINSGDMKTMPAFHLLFENGLYIANVASKSVRQFLAAPEGKKIRTLTRARGCSVVVYEDAVAFHAPVVDPYRKDLIFPGVLQFSFPIPKSVAGYPRIACGRVPDQDLAVFQAERRTGSWTSSRFVYMKSDGTILKTRNIDNFTGSEDKLHRAFGIAALYLPAAPSAAIFIADAFDPARIGTSPGMLAAMWRRSIWKTIEVFVIFFAIAALCCYAATKVSRRYGFERGLRLQWQIWAFLLGPAGLVTLWLLRDWPALETCAACSQRRPVDLELCPHCQTPMPVPTQRGIEILVDQPQPVLQVLTS